METPLHLHNNGLCVFEAMKGHSVSWRLHCIHTLSGLCVFEALKGHPVSWRLLCIHTLNDLYVFEAMKNHPVLWKHLCIHTLICAVWWCIVLSTQCILNTAWNTFRATLYTFWGIGINTEKLCLWNVARPVWQLWYIISRMNIFRVFVWFIYQTIRKWMILTIIFDKFWDIL